jgi:LuxR family maltose regulon positive regulatory protein
MFLIEPTNVLASGNMQIVAEKIRVPELATQLSRPRLLTLLEQSLKSCTATIITGRAGTGKTVLASDFARKCGRAVTWYKVDAPEAELKGFFHYLIASIRKERPNFGIEILMPLLGKDDSDQISMLAEGFVYELAEGETKPLLIVIEDLHLVCDSEWLVPFLRRLLPLLPDNVHTLITSRTMPAALWRMRSKQTLLVIEEEFLGFTRQEAIELFQTHELSSELVSIALDLTHGRAAPLIAFATMRAAEEKSVPNTGIPASNSV